MRTLDLAQQTTLKGAHYRVSLRVWVENAGGTLVNLSTLDGRDWVDEVEWDEDIDQPVSQVTVRLWREVYAQSLAPLKQTSTLNQTGAAYTPLLEAGREVVVDVATTAVGTAPAATDWRTVFHGEIDEVDWGGSASRVSLTARDLGGKLLDRFIEEERTYGSAAGVKVEDVMQKILDDNIPGSVTDPRVLLVTPVSPGWMIKEFRQEKEPLLEAVRKLAGQIGYDVRYRWHETTQKFQLTFFDPGRKRPDTAPPEDWTFGPSHYLDVSSLRSSRAAVRNVVQVVYTDSADGKRKTVVEKDDASISRFGRRFMELEEGSSSAIDTAAEAQDLAKAVLGDVGAPKAEQEIELHFFWPGEVGDTYTFLANGVHYDAPQTWAVVGMRHQLSREQQRTRIRVRGSVAGSYRDWLRKEVRVTGAAQHDPGTAILSPRVVTSASGDAADLRVGVQSDTGEWVRLYLRDGDDSPVWALVQGSGILTPRYAAPGTELGPDDWFHDGQNTFAQKLRAIPLLRDQVRRVFIQGEAQNSGAFSTWVPVTLEAKAQPWLESVDLTFSEVSDTVTLTAVGGAFCESARWQLSESPAFATLLHSADAALLDGQRAAVTFSVATLRNRTIYGRVTPYNGALASGAVTGLAGQPQQDSEFIPASEAGIEPPLAELGRASAPTLTAETISITAALGAGGTPFPSPATPVRWRTRIDHARNGQGTPGTWNTTSLTGQLTVTRDLRWEKTVVLEVEDNGGRVSTATFPVASRLDGLDDAGLVDVDLPQKGGHKIFRKGVDSVTEVVGAESQVGAEIRVASAFPGQLHKNPSFAKWTGTYPDGWSNYSGVPVKETTLVRSGGNGVRFAPTTANRGIYLADTSSAGIVQGLSNPEFLVVELDVLFVSGGAQGAGVLVDWMSTTPTAHRNVNDFHLAPELGPTPTTGVWHTVRKVVRRPTAFTGTFRGIALYLMANYATFSGGGSSKDVVFDRLVLREANQQEVNAFLGLNGEGRLVTGLENKADVGGLPARVVARQGQGIFLEEFKEVPTDWASAGATATPVAAPGGVTGTNVLRVSRGHWSGYFPNDLPFDPSKLYRLRARVRQVDDPGYSDLFTTDTLPNWDASGDVPGTWTVAPAAPGVLTADGGSQATLIRKTLSAVDALVRVDATEAFDGGVVARYQDNGNYYLLALSDDSGWSPGANLVLYKRVAGVFTQLATADVTWARGGTAMVELEVIGSSLRVLFNGTQVIAPVTDTSIPGPGRFGLRNNGPAGSLFKVDRFDVQVIGAAAAMVGHKYFYFGVRGINAAGAVVTNYYVGASAAQPATGTAWTEYTGWIRGNGTVRAPANDPTLPSGLPTTIRYIRPLVLVNWPGSFNNGTQEVDYIAIDVLDEDSAERTYKAIAGGGANIKEIPWTRGGTNEAPTNLFKRLSDSASSVVEIAGRWFTDNGMLDTSRRIVNVFRGSTNKGVGDLFDKASEGLDQIGDGSTFARVVKSTLSGGKVATVTRSGADVLTSDLFRKGADTLVDVADGGGFRRTTNAEADQTRYASQNLLGPDAGPATGAARSITLAQAGLAPGTVVSASGEIQGTIATDRWELELRFYDAAGTYLSGASSAEYTGTTLLRRTVENVTLPANTARVDVFADNVGTNTGTRTLRNVMLNRGPVALPFEEPPFRPNRETAEHVAETSGRSFTLQSMLDAGRRIVNVYRGSTTKGVGDLFDKASEGLDQINEGSTYGKVVKATLASGKVATVSRSGGDVPTTDLFRRASDTADQVVETTGRSFTLQSMLDASRRIVNVYRGSTTKGVGDLFDKATEGLDQVGEGTTYGKVVKTSLTSGMVGAVTRGGGSVLTTDLFKKGVDDVSQVVNAESQAGAQIRVDSYSAGMLTRNPTFSKWPTGNALPDGFTWWSYQPIRETTTTRSGGVAARYQITSAGADTGFHFPTHGGAMVTGYRNPDFVVLEVDFMLVSGQLGGAGILVDWRNTAGNEYRATVDFAVLLGQSPGHGVWHTVRQVVQRPSSFAGTFNGISGYVMAGWSGFQAIQVKDIVFDRMVIREPTRQEVAAFKAIRGDGTAINELPWVRGGSDVLPTDLFKKGVDDVSQVVNAESQAGAQIRVDSYSAGMLTPNPTFARWMSGNTVPDGFTHWAGPAPIRETTLTRVGGNAVRFNVGSVDAGIALHNVGQNVIPDSIGHVFVEVDVAFVSGSTSGAGVRIETYDTGGNFLGANGSLLSSEISGTPVPNRFYTVRKVLPIPGGAYRFNVFLMANWSGLGTPAAKDIVFDRLVVRAATEQEVAAFNAIRGKGTAIRELPWVRGGADVLPTDLFKKGVDDVSHVVNAESQAGAQIRVDSYSAGMLTTNPSFARWTAGASYPDGFSWWQGPGPARELSLTRVGGQAMRYAIGGGNVGAALFHLGEGVIPPDFAHVVVEVDLYLASGSIAGSGIHINTYDTGHNPVGVGGAGRMNIHFADADVLGPSPATGRWHTVRRVLRVDAGNGNAYCLFAYLMANWDGFGGGTPAKDIVFDRLVVRAATEQEVAAFTAIRGKGTAIRELPWVRGGSDVLPTELFRRGVDDYTQVVGAESVAGSMDKVERLRNLVNDTSISGTLDRWASNGGYSVTTKAFSGINIPVQQLYSAGTGHDRITYSDWFDVDPSKAYEVTLYTMSDRTDGNLYVGLHSHPYGVDTLSMDGSLAFTDNGNPYWVYGGGEEAANTWTKRIGYLLPVGTPNGASAGGIGQAVHYNHRFRPGTTRIQLRWLNYYNAAATTRWVAYVRVVELSPEALEARRRLDTVYGADGTLKGSTNIFDTADPKNVARGVRTGEAWDGVPVAFTPVFQNAPAISFGPGGVTYLATIGSTKSQTLVVQALNPTASGFTMRAKIQELVGVAPATVNAPFTQVDYSGSASTPAWHADMGGTGEAYNDQYTFVFDVYLHGYTSSGGGGDDPTRLEPM